MRPTTYAQNLHDLGLIKEQGLEEVILGHQDFSRFGKLKDQEFLDFSARARQLGMRVIFEWDILMSEKTFTQLTSHLVGLLPAIDVLRVQDPGALEWSYHHSSLPLQFIAENGNHNLEGLSAWCEAFKPRMERLVLSIELPKAQIEHYLGALSVPCELLGLGRILLFYTPRLLLSPLSEEKISFNETLTALAESEESPHKGFPVIENRHGTFMFHIKDFCLLDFAQDLCAAGLAFFRLDLRWCDPALLREINNFENLKKLYPQQLIRGFYHVNKTDVLFPKLKNARLQNRQGDYLGDVIEAQKGSHLAIMVKNPRGLRSMEKLRFIHPEGEVFESTAHNLRNLALEDVGHVESQKIALIPFVKGVWVKSQVFYSDRSD
jgi:U32 family peptidase